MIQFLYKILANNNYITKHIKLLKINIKINFYQSINVVD